MTRTHLGLGHRPTSAAGLGLTEARPDTKHRLACVALPAGLALLGAWLLGSGSVLGSYLVGPVLFASGAGGLLGYACAWALIRSASAKPE